MQNLTVNALKIVLRILGIIYFLHLSTCVNTAFAAVNPSNLIQSGYWYGDDDIGALLENRLDEEKYYIAPAIPFEDNDLLVDIVRSSVNEAKALGSALIPVNFSNHWAALAIKRSDDGTLKVIYNDPFGTPITMQENSALLANVLSAIDPSIKIIDLQVHQQTDGSSCGAFSAENLITIAELNTSNLSEADLRNILSKINDAESIRQSHFYLLLKDSNSDLFSVDLVKKELEVASSNIRSCQDQITSIITNISSVTNDRLSYLNRSSNNKGLSSGDKVPEYGIWIKGFTGSGIEKMKSNVIQDGNLSYKSSIKNKFYGITIGIDTRVREEAVFGVSYESMKSKRSAEMQSSSHIQNNTSKTDAHIFTIYGSGNVSNEIVINGNVSYGKVLIRDITDSTNSIPLNKQNGNFINSALVANYLLYSGNIVSLIPRVKVSYNDINFEEYKSNFIKIPRNNNQELQLGAGVELFADLSNNSSLSLIPELKVDYFRSLWKKGSRVQVSNFINAQILSWDVNNNKEQLKFGVGLNIVSSALELGIGYEHIIQVKKQSEAVGSCHLGYLKLKVNF